MHRLVAAALIVTLLASSGCRRGSGAMAVGTVVAITGATIMASGAGDSDHGSGCTDGPGCVDFDLDPRGPAGLALVLLGGAFIIGGGIGASVDARREQQLAEAQEDAALRAARQRRANGIWRDVPAQTDDRRAPLPPPPPPTPATTTTTPPPSRWTVKGSQRESGTWREVPPVFGDDGEE